MTVLKDTYSLREQLDVEGNTLPSVKGFVTQFQINYVLTLAPTGVRATLVPSGADNRPPPGDLENEASQRQAVIDIGYGRRNSTIFTQVIFRGQVKNDVTGVNKIKMAALENNGVFCQQLLN